tara:strand:- start:34 stop:303 length:270 start_codon:yes stop_codon:yes gene_type:complete
MAILGNIDGIPVYTTIGEALAWAANNDQEGYHQHTIGGVIGYMGGTHHAAAVSGVNPLSSAGGNGSNIDVNFNESAVANSEIPDDFTSY